MVPDGKYDFKIEDAVVVTEMTAPEARAELRGYVAKKGYAVVAGLVRTDGKRMTADEKLYFSGVGV